MPRSTTTTAAILSLVVGALSATIPVVTGTASTANLPGVTLVHAAKRSVVTALPSPLVARSMASPPEFLTINIVNSHTAAVSTAHVHDVDSPAAASGNVAGGTLAQGAAASFAVPTGYIGNLALSEAHHPISADDTLIELNFVFAKDYNVAVADVDVSYVNGYSVPITCSCSGSVVTGCNKDLLSLSSCGDLSDDNACVNPLRSDFGAVTASTFFAPCQGAAWTYVNDGDADAWGSCQSGQISCCIGTSCPANPNQPKEKRRSCVE
ncbi:putative secondary metabolism biosynthetic enzyme [Pestalotiopsis sp. IQ-011]